MILTVLLAAGGLFRDAIPVYSAEGSPLASQTWQRLGGPPGGYGSSLVVHPTDPELLYLSDLTGGVFISRDGGENWTPSNQGITVRTGTSGDLIPVSCLALDPHHENTLWAGTSDPAFMYRSEDDGATWQLRTRGIAGYVGLTLHSISFSPDEPDVIYAAAEINSKGWNYAEKTGKTFDQAKGIVFRSTDGGSWWLPVWQGDSLANLIVIDPQNSQRVFLATGAYNKEAANALVEGDSLAQMGGLGVLVSEDRGVTWLSASEGLLNRHVQSLAVHPSEEGLLLAGTGNLAFPEGAGIYRSEDTGQTWVRVGGVEGEVITAVMFTHADPQTAFASGLLHHYISRDQGQTWEISSPGEGAGWGPVGTQPGYPLQLTADPHNPGTLYTLTDLGGVYRSQDEGKSWAAVGSGYSAASIRSLSVNQANPAVVYAMTAGGPYKSVDGGETWNGITPVEYPVGRGGSIVQVDPFDPERVFLADGKTGTLLVSPDGGQTWQKTLDLGAVLAPFGSSQLGVMTLAFEPDGEKVYAGIGVLDCKLFEQDCRKPVFLSLMGSEDSGMTWKAINAWRLNGLTVLDLVIHPENQDQLWAATGAGWVLSSNDGGSTWKPLTEHLYARHITDLALDPEDNNNLIAATWNYGVFALADLEEPWQWSRLGMDPYEPVSSIVIDPTRPNVLYAGSFLRGLYLSEDGGKTWRVHNNGLSNRSVRSLGISADGNTLYAGTEGGGVFRLSTLSTEDWKVLEPTATPMPTATATTTPTQLPTTTATTLPTLTAAPATSVPTQEPTDQTPRTSCPASFIPLAAALGWTVYRPFKTRVVN